LSDSNVAARRGFALAIGVLPAEWLAQFNCVESLANAVKLEPKLEDRDAEARRNAASALAQVAIKLKGESVEKALASLIRVGMSDYATDKRGDVGSWVRSASLQGASSLLASQGDLASPAMHTLFLAAALRLASEALDRVRAHAITAIGNAIAALCSDEIGAIRALWPPPSEGDELFAWLGQALHVKRYSNDIVSGLFTCVGGSSHNLVEPAFVALREHLRQCDYAAFGALCIALIGEPRLVSCMLRSLATLLARGLVASLFGGSFVSQLLQKLRPTLRGTDVARITLALPLLTGLLASPDAAERNSVLSYTLALLVNRFPRVRQATAAALTEALLQFDGVLPVQLDEALEQLQPARWLGEDSTKERAQRLAESWKIEIAVLDAPRRAAPVQAKPEPEAAEVPKPEATPLRHLADEDEC
jgi:hypothetical protein